MTYHQPQSEDQGNFLSLRELPRPLAKGAKRPLDLQDHFKAHRTPQEIYLEEKLDKIIGVGDHPSRLPIEIYQTSRSSLRRDNWPKGIHVPLHIRHDEPKVHPGPHVQYISRISHEEHQWVV